MINLQVNNESDVVSLVNMVCEKDTDITANFAGHRADLALDRLRFNASISAKYAINDEAIQVGC